MDHVYPHLKTYWNRMPIDNNATVLVPLCGNTLDTKWLVDRGHYVIGVDISEIAIQGQLNLLSGTFQHKKVASFSCFSSNQATFWQGDFLNLQPDLIPHVDAIYDKAALIALPREKRKKYATVIKNLTDESSCILLNSFEYRQEEMTGPPFSVPEQEIKQLYGDRFKARLLHQESLFNQLQKFQQRGLSSYLKEKLYLLIPEQ